LNGWTKNVSLVHQVEVHLFSFGKSADKDTEELGTKILKQALRTYLT